MINARLLALAEHHLRNHGTDERHKAIPHPHQIDTGHARKLIAQYERLAGVPIAEQALVVVDRLRAEDAPAYEALVRRLATDVVTLPEFRVTSLLDGRPAMTEDGTSVVMADYQARGQ